RAARQRTLQGSCRLSFEQRARISTSEGSELPEACVTPPAIPFRSGQTSGLEPDWRCCGSAPGLGIAPHEGVAGPVVGPNVLQQLAAHVGDVRVGNMVADDSLHRSTSTRLLHRRSRVCLWYQVLSALT